ncbi:MAG: phage holin family protein [Actinomycetota bacterium]|nr:phage holin family protein [Actinomycetota bacterium]
MAAPNSNEDNFAAAVSEVSERVSVLVREELELAKAEMSRKASSMARGAAAVAAGAVFGVFAIIFALLTLAWWLNDLLGHLWPGFLIVFGGLLVLTVGAFLFAWRKLKVGAPTPTMAIDEAKKIKRTVSEKSAGAR